MSLFQRVSFRQLLLLAFLLIAGLLAAASIGGLLTLERLLAQSRAVTERDIALTAAAQRLAERSVTMERAARQFLVLEDPALLRRYQDAALDATRTLEELLVGELDSELVTHWRAHLAAIGDQLPGPKATALVRESSLTGRFSELNLINAMIAAEVRNDSDERNRLLQAEVESGRARLARQVMGAIGLSVMLAVGFGVWLTRPLGRLERAIVGLGENRLDQPVDVRGPRDLRSLGQRLEWLRVRLKEVDEDKARFLRHVSHELKTPLAAMREGVSVLHDGVAGPLTASQREVTEILGHNTAALQAQIEDLLRFNAAAFESRRLSRQATELVGLVRRLVEAQRLQWQARELKVVVAGDPVQVDVDPDKLGTALGNLLSNAIRFSPHGGEIRLSVESQDDQVRIDVIDHGPGIADSDRGRIFDPFFRGERQPEGALRGTGIGLSIVRHYVEAHGGRIELVASGRGAHFRLELPNDAA